jgi:spore maturation protein CgeB
MRILIVGSDKHWAIENYFLDYFQNQEGIKAELFPAHNIFHQFYYRSIVNKVSFRLGLSRIYQKINAGLLENVKNFQPDIVWVFKGMEIFPGTLKKLKEQSLFLVNYNPDHPFVFAHRGSGNQNVLEGIPYYDLHLSYSKNILLEIQKKYGIKGEWLPFAYQPNEKVIHIPKQDKNRVCFIGNPDKIRTNFIRFLGERGIPVDVYGHYWEKYLKKLGNLPIRIHAPVFQEAFQQTAVQYRVQLNIFRPQNKDSHNMRTFEMPALGCIMLAPYSIEHSILFEENKEAFYYRDQEEAFRKAQQILALSQEQAFQIKQNALNRSKGSGYTYDDRARQVLEYFRHHLKRPKEIAGK